MDGTSVQGSTPLEYAAPQPKWHTGGHVCHSRLVFRTDSSSGIVRVWVWGLRSWHSCTQTKTLDPNCFNLWLGHSHKLKVLFDCYETAVHISLREGVRPSHASVSDDRLTADCTDHLVKPYKVLCKTIENMSRVSTGIHKTPAAHT